MLPLTNTAGDPSAPYYVIYLIAVTKLTDMGAYLVGSLCGRHKAIPHISPAKSWEGYFGSLFFAQGGAFLIYFLGGEHFAWFGGWHHVVVLGVILALSAMIGDLAESILKRSLHVKDSGHVLPGIAAGAAKGVLVVAIYGLLLIGRRRLFGGR